MCSLALLIFFRFILGNVQEYLVPQQVSLTFKRFTSILKVDEQVTDITGEVTFMKFPIFLGHSKQCTYDNRSTDRTCLRVLLLVHIIITVVATIAEALALFRFEGLKEFLPLFYQTPLTFSGLRHYDDKFLGRIFHGISMLNVFLLVVSRITCNSLFKNFDISSTSLVHSH
jgi:hypothetical protein